ncbi:CD36 family [Popillia japonica]|uniref:Scavenger receptor class B member 1 n=1 Tax=Popillia japonica TaxID=7064 RepID=A0AAW1N4I0_POPJA
MKGREKLWTKLSSAFLRKWWFVAAISIGIVLLGIIIAVFFMSWFNLILHHQIVLRPGSQTFDLWSKPPVNPVYKVYIFNVTNADEFLNNQSKPIVNEVGPYVYM